MWFYIKLAWRNIFRNKRRTIIAGIAIAIGMASLILSDAFMIGMENNIVKSATASFLGERTCPVYPISFLLLLFV